MTELLQLAKTEVADSFLSFRGRAYSSGDQGEFVRDVLALANAAAIGRRYLFIGVADAPGQRTFPGISERTWRRTREVLPQFLAEAVEPPLRVTFESLEVDGALVGVVCLEGCDDPPYLLACRIGDDMPAGSGWVRRGATQSRLRREHLQRIFEARYVRDGGDVQVGFPGPLPREEIELPALSLANLPSAQAAHNINRILEAKRTAKSVLGRSDSRIARLVFAQVASGQPYREQGTKTMLMKLIDAPGEHSVADAHYEYEVRAHRLNLMLNNLGDRAHQSLVLTLKLPRVEGMGVVERLYLPPGAAAPKNTVYPKVDCGPRAISIQVGGIEIPRRGTAQAFIEPPRMWLREAAVGQMIRMAYSLHGPTLSAPVRGRLKIHVTD
jgi:hypothetical protein